ncbi:MAG: hypothetical protein QM608_11975 [Caulobacter sp.]
MTRIRNLSIIGLALVLAGCDAAPRQKQVEAALLAQWPQVKAEMLDQAAFFDDHAAQFEAGAALSAHVSRSLGSEDMLSAGANSVVAEDRANAAHLRAIAAGQPPKLTANACAAAKPEPGYNCDIAYTVETAQGPVTFKDVRVRLLKDDKGWRIVG